MKRGVLALAGVLIVLAACVYVLPLKIWLAHQIKTQLAAQGLPGVDFDIKAISLYSMAVENAQTASGFVLKSLTLAYTPQELWYGRLRDIRIKDLSFQAIQDGDRWNVSGYTSAQEGGGLHIPATEVEINAIPLERLSIEDSQVELTSPQWRMLVPFSLDWDRAGKVLRLEGGAIGFHMQDLNGMASGARAEVSFKDGAWVGAWSVAAVSVPDWPPIAVNGEIRIKEQVLHLTGIITVQDGSGSIGFTFTFPFNDPTAMSLFVHDGIMAWAQGKISLQKTHVPLQVGQKIAMNLKAEKISLEALLRLLSGQEITASGTISGMLPVTVSPDGTIGLKAGHFGANGQGEITVPATVIPGEGMQIDLTRQVLDGFAYDTLSINVEETPDGRAAIILNLAGNNPKVYDGRAVKLNVRLGGDVLEFLQSNINMLMRPDAMLRQEMK